MLDFPLDLGVIDDSSLKSPIFYFQEAFISSFIILWSGLLSLRDLFRHF